jgi:hypothetical protein
MKTFSILFLGAILIASTLMNLAFTFAPKAMTKAVLQMLAT